ncbi:MAG: hypothetical protein ACJA08_000828 [Cyclobacteriaceae bacterium]|jgi:hypothetical protein
MKHRPVIEKAKVTIDTSLEEAFQNKTLRPIIKMKHDLLIKYTKNYIANKKHDFALLNLEKQLNYVSSCFEQDHRLRNELRGMVIGQYTVDEYVSYCQISKAINKRIVNIIKERMIDHIDVLS